MKKLLIISCLLPSLVSAMQIDRENLQVPEKLGDISVFKTDNGFEIENANTARVAVPSHRINKELRSMDIFQTAKFLKMGYIAVNHSEDGQYSLKSHGRIAGGGPVLAGLLYAVTKGTCYGVGLAAAGFGVATAAPSVVAGGGGVVLSIIGGSIGGTTGGVAGGIAAFLGYGPASLAAASTTIGGVAASTGSAMGVLAAIEGLANAAFLAGMAAPTP